MEDGIEGVDVVARFKNLVNNLIADHKPAPKAKEQERELRAMDRLFAKAENELKTIQFETAKKYPKKVA